MKAPVYTIGQNSSGAHQSSPAWIVAFYTFAEPRVGYGSSAGKLDKLETNPPILILNDAVSVTVSRPKQSFFKSMSATLMNGELNYKQRVRSGDYMVVWMFEWQDDANRVFELLRQGKAANGFFDGLKGIGRVTSISESEAVSGDGKPDHTTQIQAQMFAEFGSSVYVNPLVDINTAADIQAPQGSETLLQNIAGVLFEKYLKEGGKYKDPGNIIRLLVQIFLGTGPGKGQVQSLFDQLKIDASFSEPITVPKEVGSIFGVNRAAPVVDNMHFYIGVEQYRAGNVNPRSSVTNGARMHPVGAALEDGTFRMYKSRPLKGAILLDIAPWSNQPVVSILSSFLNPVCNEMFSCLRYDSVGGIRPTVVARQIPFSTNLLYAIVGTRQSSLLEQVQNVNRNQLTISPESVTSVTEYASLPRWRIARSRIKSKNLGTDESRRVNFVQVFSSQVASIFDQVQVDQEGQKAVAALRQNEQVVQYALENFVKDQQDIRRNGLKASVMQTPFDVITTQDGLGAGQFIRQAPYWAALQADFQFNGHLHEGGRISVTGITEPICEGDNLEVDGVVYHIEGVEHMARMQGSQKEFVTILSVSRGTMASSLDSGQGVPVYPCQINTYSSGPFGSTDRQFTLHSNRDEDGVASQVTELALGAKKKSKTGVRRK